MIKKLLFLLLAFSVLSCGSSKKTASKRRVVKTKTTKTRTSTKRSSSKSHAIVATALKYKGTRYKYGGTTKKGMDCSGLMYVAFKTHQVLLPRVSYEQAKRGKKISKSSVKKGDLLFFRTNKNKKRINHVGLVVEAKKGVIKFIHSTTSRGVLVSSLDERYWKNAFAEARRVL
ncbi:C40 family peptidase [uncultured Kordia sp.]|uniref:C40 family peptidase n=1 Tax=uncultured Kordia sp. TaxID=507699 RepID=UPI002608D16D|nr:C40 family peptidase [uncultured Kordia sp.]